jgi:hypothetical protein
LLKNGLGLFFPSYSLVVALSAAGHWQKGKNVFVLCAIWIYHVPIIIFEEIIRLSYYSGESFLWNGLGLFLIFSGEAKGMIYISIEEEIVIA